VTTFAEFVLAGVSLGFVYALLAMGVVIVFKASEVINFAQGSMVVVGAFAVAELAPEIGFWAAVAVGVATAALLAWGIERLLIRTARGATTASLTILTLGVDIVLITEMTRRIGVNARNLNGPWGSDLLTLGSLSIPISRVYAAIAALLILIAFFVAMRYSAWGVNSRAAAEDPEAASLMGIRLRRVSASAWVLAGVFAAVAAIFLTAFPSPGLDANTAQAALVVIPAAILGGLDSPLGAVVGGVTIAVAQALATGYADQLEFLGSGFGSVMPYLVMFVVLLIRPSGLFGTKEMLRV
jgi:branched-chain amino acid transport system permease protein